MRDKVALCWEDDLRIQLGLFSDDFVLGKLDVPMGAFGTERLIG